VPYVSVKVCVPGTSTCQVIDHIMVDTGSSGLRIMSSVLDSAIALPAIKVGSAPLIECVQFADGYSWGAMHTADVRIAGEVASGIPVQVIGDASSYSPPGTCSNPQNSATVLTPLNDVISFGANGVLGVGLFAQDCGSGCVGNANNFYYACPTTSSCAESGAALNQQATNPVYAFAGDNNGVLLQFPAVTPASGALNTQGSLIFGINTATNNQAQLNNSLNVYQADSTGDFFSSITSLSTNTYTYTSTPYGNSFIDSGSNGIYVPGTTIATETYGWFAPVVAASGSLATNVISLGATQQGSTGGGYVNGTQTSTPTGYTNVLSFDIANADTVLFPSGGGTDTVFNGLGAPSSGSATSTGGIDWGLPFFLGKSVYIGLEAKQITVGTATPTGPFWAY
jgi:hypothetical protein